MRGATLRNGAENTPRKISIHAPLAGCDLLQRRCSSQPCHFNPRTPCGVRRRRRTHLLRRTRISIHAPLAGCDYKVLSALSARFISIHAPLAGCDHASERYLPARPYFNPRTPCGVRLAKRITRNLDSKISIHAPLAGCDRWTTTSATTTTHFNPRTPCGVRPLVIANYASWGDISIHAPLAGCDSDFTCDYCYF